MNTAGSNVAGIRWTWIDVIRDRPVSRHSMLLASNDDNDGCRLCDNRHKMTGPFNIRSDASILTDPLGRPSHFISRRTRAAVHAAAVSIVWSTSFIGTRLPFFHLAISDKVDLF